MSYPDTYALISELSHFPGIFVEIAPCVVSGRDAMRTGH